MMSGWGKAWWHGMKPGNIKGLTGNIGTWEYWWKEVEGGI